jgi:hypothetical protein
MDLVRAVVKALREMALLVSPTYLLWDRGLSVAHRLSEAAAKWGYHEAHRWRFDRAFIEYWGLFVNNRFWAY